MFFAGSILKIKSISHNWTLYRAIIKSYHLFAWKMISLTTVAIIHRFLENFWNQRLLIWSKTVGILQIKRKFFMGYWWWVKSPSKVKVCDSVCRCGIVAPKPIDLFSFFKKKLTWWSWRLARTSCFG